jgi:two-component system phosphate regulon sensor histidine kinase PhoR
MQRTGLVRLGQYARHRLSQKLALTTGGIGAVVLLAGYLVLDWGPVWSLVVAALLLLAGTYAGAVALLAPRMELARSTLEQIRKRRFDHLEAVAHRPGGDELNNLLSQAYRTGQVLEKEIEALRKVENYRREFLGNVSHELKTPIFSIRGYAETLLDGALEDPVVNRGFVEKILRNANRLGHLTNDLVEISRIETGELKMTMKPFDLARTTQEVTELLEPVAQDRSVQMLNLVPRTLPLVMGDEDRIRQVLVNLADNAIKYNNPGGHVELVARLLPSGEVKVWVADDGLGIAPQHLPRLTERFYRVDKSRSRQQGGTGLGLAIVKHILGAHNRTLMIESSPAAGSTFGFVLPAAPAGTTTATPPEPDGTR